MVFLKKVHFRLFFCTTTTAHAYFFYFVNANILAMLLNDLSGYHITCTYDT